MSKPMVSCSVANCKFWEEGNKCIAESILIDIDAHANREYDLETGTLIDEDKHRDYAASVSSTCCHTFTPKQLSER